MKHRPSTHTGALVPCQQARAHRRWTLTGCPTSRTPKRSRRLFLCWTGLALRAVPRWRGNTHEDIDAFLVKSARSCAQWGCRTTRARTRRSPRKFLQKSQLWRPQARRVAGGGGVIRHLWTATTRCAWCEPRPPARASRPACRSNAHQTTPFYGRRGFVV